MTNPAQENAPVGSAAVDRSTDLDRDDGDTRLAEDVYQRLRSEIIHGLLRPNERLVETDLARRLGASRTPVRESLQRLAQDGVVDSSKHGWLVHDHTVEEIAEIYEIRTALEGYAARLAALRATPEQLLALEQLVEDVGGLDAAESLAEASARNTEFHDAVVRLAANGRLMDLVQRSRNYAFNTRLGRLYSLSELEDSSREHLELLAALRSRDADSAETIARRHVEAAYTIIADRV